MISVQAAVEWKGRGKVAVAVVYSNEPQRLNAVENAPAQDVYCWYSGRERCLLVEKLPKLFLNLEEQRHWLDGLC